MVASPTFLTSAFYDDKIVAIDPGQTGALVSIDADTGDLIDCIDMPIVQFSNSKSKIVDGFVVSKWLEENRPKLICIEMVGARPAKRYRAADGEMVAGQGIASTFQFGMSYGSVVALSLAFGCQVELVTPSKWKTWMNVLGDKELARQWCLKRHPNHEHLYRFKKYDGRSDATVLAEYSRTYVSKNSR